MGQTRHPPGWACRPAGTRLLVFRLHPGIPIALLLGPSALPFALRAATAGQLGRFIKAICTCPVKGRPSRVQIGQGDTFFSRTQTVGALSARGDLLGDAALLEGSSHALVASTVIQEGLQKLEVATRVGPRSTKNVVDNYSFVSPCRVYASSVLKHFKLA
ncbi:hypothetical protein BP00DRAFT_447020 [Aspergillus indologenus CBS 114.80]|uniref:Uncharacterized protein n=1 Tax=Aspergillus indologenus CBS 114.80 TaxID=1450541 RepID=A0A2V5I2H3_9EURO|nr:hypothetical protein BP00DRAFT_447020 [Aspergillus indologenus CBS 114.80]